MHSSIHLLPPVGDSIREVGLKVHGAGWWGHCRGLHTVAIRVSNFTGRIAVQASLALDPAERDWYSVLPEQVDYLEYPHFNMIQSPNQSGETSVKAFNFRTNAVWVRAVMDRSYLATPSPFAPSPYGTVVYVMLNH